MRDLFEPDEPTVNATPEAAPAKERNEDKNTGKKTGVFRTLTRHFERRLKSEILLEDALPWHFKQGEAYHSFTFGDIDALAYLRAILKQQPLEYVCLSTFSMAITDAETLVKWQQQGLIGHFDLYLGEIFDSKFVEVYNTLRAALTPQGGRIAVFRNHSKVIAGFGERFDFAIEGSANLNSNPRCEQTVITCDTGVARFYKEEIFDNIQSFNNDFENWKPYKLKRDETI
jgi:hypothetical protein